MAKIFSKFWTSSWRNFIFFTLTSLGLGSLFYSCTYRILPARYLSTIAATIDLDSLPAIRDPEKVSSGFNSLFTNPSELNQILKIIFFDQEHKIDRYNPFLFIDDFIIKDKFDRRIFDFESNMENYIIKINFPANGFKKNLGKRILAGINEVVRSKNKRHSLANEIISKKNLEISLKNFNVRYRNFKEISPEYEAIQISIRSNIYQIEYELRKLASDSHLKIDYLREASTNHKNQEVNVTNLVFTNEQNNLIKPLSHDINPLIVEPTLKLLSILKTHQILSEKQLDGYYKRINAETTRGINFNDAVTDKKSIRLAAIYNLNRAAVEFATPIDRNKEFLPELELDQDYFQVSLENGLIEQPHSYRKIYGIFCLMSGFFIVGASALLLRKRPARKRSKT